MTTRSLLEQRELMFAEVGRGLSAWSNVEHEIYTIANLTSGLDDMEFTARLLDCVIAFDAKLKMTATCIDKYDPPHPLRLYWDAFTKEIGRQKKRRDQIGHFQIVRGNGHYRLIPFFSKAKHNKDGFSGGRTLAELRQFTAEFEDLRQALAWFYLSLQLCRDTELPPIPTQASAPTRRIQNAVARSLQDTQQPRR